MFPLNELQQEFGRKTFDLGSIKFGDFELKDKSRSPIYVDYRLLRSDPNILDTAVLLFKEMMEGLKVDRLADIPLSISPVVAVLSHVTRIPMVTPRPPKDHGTKATIEGLYKPGEIVGVFDDLITKATSKFEAFEPLEAAGLVVKDVFVLLDRCQGGAAQLEKAGYTLHSAIKLPELLDFYVEDGKLNSDKRHEVMNYLAANQYAA